MKGLNSCLINVLENQLQECILSFSQTEMFGKCFEVFDKQSLLFSEEE